MTGIHFKDLRPYQKDVYSMVIMQAYIRNGITTKEVTKLVEALEPVMMLFETNGTGAYAPEVAARFVIQALRGDGYLVTRRIQGLGHVVYELTPRFRDFFCRVGCYGEVGQRCFD